MPSRLPARFAGPRLSFHGNGHSHAEGEAALARQSPSLRDGGIVAVKGVGGYHLMCDPASDAAVRRLRQRKHRPDKPLAVMFPQAGEDGLDAVRRIRRFSTRRKRAPVPIPCARSCWRGGAAIAA